MGQAMYLAHMSAAVWIAILVIMLIIELATMGLTTIWFAGGALAAFFVSLLGGGWVLQIVLFLAVSIVLLIFTRPIAKNHFNGNRTRTNAQSLIGQNGVVTEEIDNLAGKGQVQIHGMDWTARTADNRKLEKGRVVVVREIQGVKLIVEETAPDE